MRNLKFSALTAFSFLTLLVAMSSPVYPQEATISVQPQVEAGGYHTVGLKSDGTVVAVGYNYGGQCNVSGWTGITQVAAGVNHTVGLKADGTVVAVGSNDWGQCNVASWTGITQVAAGGYHTVGLKADGTVVAVGDNPYGQCNVEGWTGIIQVAAGWFHTIGLESDRTVVAVGLNDYGQCNVEDWLLLRTITVLVDIKPGSYPNSINLGSNGSVPVAILSSPVFDAATVDPFSVTLAGATVRVKGKGSSCFIEDVNGDGLMDIVVHVDTQALQLCRTDTYAKLTGTTFDGAKIAGMDMVRIVRE